MSRNAPRMSLKTLLLAGAMALTGLSGMAHAQDAKKPFTYSDMLMLDRLSGLNVNAQGDLVVFSVRATDMDKNKGVSTLMLKNLAAPGTPEYPVQGAQTGDSDAQFAPDGKSLYFLSGRGSDGTTQVWQVFVNSPMRPMQVTKLPLDIQAFQVTPDGKGLVIAMAVFPECKGDEIACTVKKVADRKADKSTGDVYTKVFVRHWDTWADGTRNHLFYVPADHSAEPVALTDGYDGDVPSKPFGDEGDYTISPDGKTVYFSAREAGTTEPWSTNFDVYSVPVTGGPITDLTPDNKAWDASPRVSPDGKTVAYKAMKRPGFEADRFGLKLMDASGKVSDLAPDWDRSVDDMKWARDGKSLLVIAADVGLERLFRIDVKTGKVTAMSQSGHMDAFFETPKGFVFTQDSLTHPALMYASQPKAAMIDSNPVVLTKVDANLAGMEMGQYEQFSFKGWNGDDVHGYVVKPAGYVEGKQYPVAFLIHGGPQGSFGDDWSFRWNPETYAGAGYAVVMIDFHGSTGYGQDFEDAISQHWGDRPLEDLQKGWTAALAQYTFLDGNRACALGASYGGFMANWIAGNWKEPWKCIVSHDGVFDARSMGFSTEEQWFENWEHGANAFSDPAVYDKFNPALHVKDWSVPMLIVHSDKDFRIPVDQGIGAFTALQSKGIESEFLHFPDENHWVLKPQNSMKWHKTVFDWLDSHIGDKAASADTKAAQ